MRRLLLAATAAALLAGCGTTVPPTAGSAPAGDGLEVAPQQPAGDDLAVGPGGQPVAPGVTGPLPTRGATAGAPVATGGPALRTQAAGPRITAPLALGVVLTKTSNAASFGVSAGNTVSERSVVEAVISALNAKGGLGGRRITPVYAETDTGSSNWETDFAAACSAFTEDHRVSAVLGYVFNYSPAFERCLASKGIAHLSTGFNVPDRKELAKFPLQLDLTVPTIDRRGLLKLVNGKADGILTASSRIGVLADSCPGTQSSLNGVFLPKARQLGLTVVKTVALSCPGGASDSSSAVSALQGAVLQFASNRVDRVVFHASSEGPPLLLFSISAETQGYRPGYVVSSLANLDVVRGFVPVNQIKNVHGYGWLPTQDLPPSAYGRPTAEQSRCLGLMRSKGVSPTSSTDYYVAYQFCEAVFAYDQALRLTGGDSTATRVVAAVRSLGAGFPSLTNQGGSQFAADRPDAPRLARHALFSSGCRCFTYSGPFRPIPLS